jgi:hypothetical protein
VTVLGGQLLVQGDQQHSSVGAGTDATKMHKSFEKQLTSIQQGI